MFALTHHKMLCFPLTEALLWLASTTPTLIDACNPTSCLPQLALEKGLFLLSPAASLASSAGPPAAHALATLPSLDSSGALSQPLAGSNAAAMSQSGATGAGGLTGRRAHVSAVRVNVRAVVATALEVASALRYLHDLVGGAGGLAAVHSTYHVLVCFGVLMQNPFYA